MDAGIDVARATCGGAYAEEQEARDAHAQQDGEEELGPTGRVHGFAASRAGLWKPFVGGGLCGGSPEDSSQRKRGSVSRGLRENCARTRVRITSRAAILGRARLAG